MRKIRKRRRKKLMRQIRHTAWIVIISFAIIAAARMLCEQPAFDAEKLENKGCPESLIELAERNPEAIDFVNDFDRYQGNPEDIDITGDVVKGEIPLFLQWDERWGYETYGSNYLAITGCGPTCVSMVYCGLTGKTDRNPYEVAKRAESEGFYVEGSGSSWNMMELLPEEFGLEVHTVIFDEEHIKSELDCGRPIICILGPGDFTAVGHFIVLTGVDENGKIVVNDPNSILNSKKSWNIQSLMPQIRNLWSYSVG